jgi:hypothetical protein
MKTLNETFMEGAAAKASEGLVTLSRSVVQAGMPLYRFADTRQPELYFTGKWWVGHSPFEALRQHAERRNQTLSVAARQCLAVDFAWSKLDVLHKVILKAPLSAWAGTPRTQRIRQANSAGGDRRWEPDREVTQLCIPGLEQPDPNNPRHKIWESAFQTPFRLHLV